MPKVDKREAKRVVKIVSEETQAMPSSKPYFNVEFAPGRFLVYSHFKGQDFIHIREYVVRGEKSYPSKKGACFTPGRLRVLREKIDLIDAMLILNVTPILKIGEPTYKEHLGAGIYVSISEG